MVHAAQDRNLEPFPLIETGQRVVAPPEGVHPFYTKYINAAGVVIVSSDAVPDAALTAAYRTIVHLTSRRPDVLQAMVPNHPRISIMGLSETASGLPEFGPSSDGEWGLGQMPGSSTSLVSVSGVCYPGNTEYRANFLLHEFVHAMQNLGWPTTDPEIEDEIWAAYVNAVERGQFEAPRDEPLEGITPFDAYGDDEYLTHNINAWFDLNESLPGPWVDVQIGDSGPPSGTRAELRERDPQLYEIISRFMPDSLGDLMDGCGAAAPPYDPPSTPHNPHRVVYEGIEGPGAGKHIVLIAGDHEYRSEEILPAMGRILAKTLGFKCSVFFTLDAEGFIEPGSSDIAGLEALETADLLIVGLRFQDFPGEEMQQVVDYLERGGPVLGIRTSTHAFRIAEGPFATYSYDYPGDEYKSGFGRQVLGETWAGHYGTNHEQSSRIVPHEDQATHPILRGVRDVHVQSGGYKADPMPGSVVLAMGQVLNGMRPDSPPDPEKELMPVAWTRSYEAADGKQARVFTTTHGASEDFLNAGFRRMLLNAALWTVGLEDSIEVDSDISFVGPYNPVVFGFDAYRRGVKPADLAGWETPIMSASKPTRN